MRIRPLAHALLLSLAFAGAPALAQENVDKVFGGITAEAGREYRSRDTVNGGITVRARAIGRKTATGNGGISIADGVAVGGDIGNVNGAISIAAAGVGGGITTTNGDVTLEGATVRGDLRVEKPTGWFSNRNRLPRIVIGAGTVVEGDLVFEREVELYVHPDARVGKQTGTTPRMIDSPDAPRAD